MKKLLIASAAALALAAPSARAFGPDCTPCPVVPFRLEARTVVCYRAETRTELRPVQRTITRQVPETTVQEFQEKVLVHFWRDEERKKEIIVITPTEEKRTKTLFSVECKEETRVKTRMMPVYQEVERPCPSLIVGCEDEKRTTTRMQPATQEETRTRTLYTMKTVPQLIVSRQVAGCLTLVPGGCGMADILHYAAAVHATTDVIYHNLPETRDETYKVTTDTFQPKDESCTVTVPTFKAMKPVKVSECNYREHQEKYTATVIEATPKEQAYTVPICEYKPKSVPLETVKVLDVREETKTHRVPVTTYRTVAEVVTEMVPCTVTVQVPYEKQVWVPVCK